MHKPLGTNLVNSVCALVQMEILKSDLIVLRKIQKNARLVMPDQVFTIKQILKQVRLSVGDSAPDVTFTELEQTIFCISELTDRGEHLVLIFSRTHWGPFCMQQLVELQKHSETFNELNVSWYSCSVKNLWA